MSKADSPLVSIIIPTYNNEETIEMCLESIVRQTYKDIEVIIVDNYSTDSTPKLCRQSPFQLIQKEATRSEARVIGANKSKGEYLFHIDSDMELSKGLVSDCVSKCSGTADALVIPERNISNSYWGKCIDFQKKYMNSCKRGYLRFLPRVLYFEAGPHNLNLIAGEDRYLHYSVEKTGAKISFSESYIKHHIGDPGFLEILSQRAQYSDTLTEFDQATEKSEIQSEEDWRISVFLWLFFKDMIHGIGYILLTLSTLLINTYKRKLD